MRSFAVVLVTVVAPMGTVAVTPVQKVIMMMNGMLEKGKLEKHDEAVQFAAYKQFCGDTQAEKQRSVNLAGDQIGMLKADIQKAETDAAELQQKIAEIDADVATWSGDLKASAKVREIERAEYDKVHTDYSESIDAIEKAVQILKQQAHDRAQAPQPEAKALLQGVMSLAKIPEDKKRDIEAFLADSESEDPLDQTPPEANAYEFRSTSIVDMLEKLRDKFVDERTALEKEEMSKRHAFEVLQQDLQKSVASGEQSRASKSQARAKDLQNAATMKGDLEDTQTTKADDEKYLNDITATCSQKDSAFGERQQLRADEIAAIEKAIEVLSGVQVSGSSEKYLTLVQRRGSLKGTALLQVRSDSRDDPNQLRVAAYLSEQATTIGSPILSALAVRARDDPFIKVKKMIKDLINRLMDQAGEEASHEGWCKTELAENEQVRTSRSSDVEQLQSEIDELQASLAKLAAETTELTQRVVALDKAVAEKMKIRAEMKSENEQTVKDAQLAQTAVSQAITVLQEFYATAAEATSLIQQGKVTQEPAPAPEVFEGAYKGMGGESGGVIAMLEVIQSDFARLEAETRGMENTDSADHDKFMTDTAVDKTAVTKDIEHKTVQKRDREQALTDKNNDVVSEQKELDAANTYFEKLKPSCLNAGMSYAERAERRQEEIASLQEALRILNGEDIALLERMQQ